VGGWDWNRLSRGQRPLCGPPMAHSGSTPHAQTLPHPRTAGVLYRRCLRRILCAHWRFRKQVFIVEVTTCPVLTTALRAMT